MGDGKLILNCYKLGERLGQGGMGTVYHGVNVQSGQPVAIKLLNPEVVASDPLVVERFDREAQVLRDLDHPNIVKVLATAQTDDKHYLVMEYVGGGCLSDLLIQQGQLSVVETLEISLDLADALTRAHRLKIIHRDIKPANVLLAEDGTPRLTDFGMAHVANNSRLTQAGMVIGTIGYLSPEACLGQEPDVYTDIWAFGVMLFEMLTGRLPFEGDNPLAMVMAITTQPVPDLEILRPDIPIALIDLINRMLEKDRQARIPSIRLVGAELEAILQGRETPPPAEEIARFSTPTPIPADIPKHNLPAQITPFVGREVELIELAQLFEDPLTRIVTILGPGGMGKTRLAIQAAEGQLPFFEQGVYFVPLAALSSAEDTIPAVAEAVGFQFYSSGDPKGQLISFFRQKQMLLVFDNFEHVLEGASFVHEILQSAPDIKVIATSREKLNLQGEIRFQIGGMDFPDMESPKELALSLEQATEYSAIKLFIQGARRARPGFKLEAENLKHIARICRMVEGMPLGILLAAAWVEVFSPIEIADEISQNLDFLGTEMQDVPERHRSIRAVFDSSWSQLTEVEREVFVILSVFQGGFTREAGQAVAGANLRTLIRLVNKSILRRDPFSGRYQIHELLRRYAWEKLDASGKGNATRDAHCAYYSDFLSQRQTDVTGKRQIETLNQIETDFPNIKQAWYWAVEQKNYAAIDHMSEMIYVFCEWLNRYHEGEELFQRARQRLAPHPGDEPQPAWGRVLLPWYDLRTEGRGRLEDKDNIKTQAEIALAGAQKHGDRLGIGHACVLLGAIAEDSGDHHQAISNYEQGLAQCADMGDSYWATIRVGFCYRKVGEHEKALMSFERSLKRGRERGDKIKIAWSLFNIGESVLIDTEHVDEGLLTKVERYWLEANNLFRQVGSPVGIVWTNTNLSLISFLKRDFEQVKRLAEEILNITADLNLTTYGNKEALGMIADVACVEGDYAKAKRFLLDWISSGPTMQRALSSVIVYCRPVLMIMVLPSLAFLLARQDRKEKAVFLLALAYSHPATRKDFLDKWPLISSMRADIEAELGEDVFKAAWRRGQTLDFDHALAEILSDLKASQFS